MPVEIIYKNRRSDINNRTHLSTHNNIEKQKNADRRKLEEKLKHLIENNIKDQNRETQKLIQLSSGNVILKRKSKNGQHRVNTDTHALNQKTA